MMNLISASLYSVILYTDDEFFCCDRNCAGVNFTWDKLYRNKFYGNELPGTNCSDTHLS